MDVGILVDYARWEWARAAVQLAELLAARARVHIFSTSSQPVQFHARWDRAVFPLSRIDIAYWARAYRPRLMIWLGLCDTEVIKYVALLEEPRIRTVVVASEVAPAHAKWVDLAFGGIMTPTAVAHEALMRQFPSERLFPCPWAPVRSVLLRDPAATEPVQVEICLAGEAAQTWWLPALDVARVLCRNPPPRGIRVTLSHGGLYPRARRQIDRAARGSGGLLRVVATGSYQDELRRLARADLTLLPAPADALGMGILLSQSMGALPVVPEGPVAQEMIRDGGNGLLVRADGNGWAEPGAMLQATLLALAPGAMLSHMQGETASGLPRRRAEFEAIWKLLLDQSE
jgi:hypothetical protein